MKELWDPILPEVTPEDIRHMRNRLLQFEATAVVPKSEQRAITPCATEWCRMIVAGSLAFASRLHRVPAALPPALPSAGAGLAGPVADAGEEARRAALDVLPGFRGLVEKARIPDAAALALVRDVEGLGAVDAYELQPADWRGLPSWGGLRALEQRRLYEALDAPAR